VATGGTWKTGLQTLALVMIPFVATPTYADIHALGWLAGCWAQDGQDAGSAEQWMAPAGKSMLGINRTVRNGTTVAFEFMRIIEDDQGEIVFIASPSGQETARFVLTSISKSELVFENPDHDFPQRIIYRLADKDTLVGRIEGNVSGVDRAVDFPMTRISCAAR
jgi:hypothetical protein